MVEIVFLPLSLRKLQGFRISMLGSRDRNQLYISYCIKISHHPILFILSYGTYPRSVVLITVCVCVPEIVLK